MRVSCDHPIAAHDDLDSVTSLHSNDSIFSSGSEAASTRSFYHRSPITVRTSTPQSSGYGRYDSPSPPAASSPPQCSSPAVSASSMAASTTTTCTNPTPLLKASLNAPVAAYYTNYRSSREQPQPATISILATTKHKPDDSNGLSNVQSSFYSSLVQQLRAKTGVSIAPSTDHSKSLLTVSTSGVRTGKKEKSGVGNGKALPFVCQVCNKRFQRHIALNAHFQNEHISAAGPVNGERSCKLCGANASDLAGIRLHLRSVHNIDLDNPMKCLDDGVKSGVTVQVSTNSKTSLPPQSHSPAILEICSRPLSAAQLLQQQQQEESEPSCSNIEMYESESCSPTASISTSPARTPSSSASPERSIYSLKQDPCHPHNIIMEDDDPQVEDLRIRKPSPVLSRRCSPAPPRRSPSPASLLPSAKRHKGVDNDYQLDESETGLNLSSTAKKSSVTITAVPAANQSSTTCSYCNIVYPNQTLYFLHRGFHSESNPWRCNSCGHVAADLYDFNTHLFSASHK